MDSVQAYAIIEEIAATSSRNDKEAILDRHIGDPFFRAVLTYAYDTFITFGITPPKVKKFNIGTFDELSPGVFSTLEDLRHRRLTGNAAKARVQELLSNCEPHSSELLRRILAKDLRAGFGKSTINRVLPGTIVTFDVMLSKGYEEKRIKEWPVAVEPKLDGLRAMSLCVDGQSRAFSRVGNHFPALDHLSDPVAAMVRNAWLWAQQNPTPTMDVFHKMLGGAAGPKLAIDAEAITGGFNKTSGDVKRKSVQAEDVVLHVFDCLPYDLLTGDEPDIRIPYRLRRRFTEFVVSCAPETAPIVATPMELASSHEEIWAIVEKHWAAGLEGGMVKPLAGFYYKKRHYDLMKVKAEETEDLRIKGWFLGKDGTRLEGKFAGFIVDREGVDCRVGGGFSHEQLEEFDSACRRDDELVKAEPGRARVAYECLGRLIEVEFHEVTPDGSLRHPRFVRFRDDKDETLKVAA